MMEKVREVVGMGREEERDMVRGREEEGERGKTTRQRKSETGLGVGGKKGRGGRGGRG